MKKLITIESKSFKLKEVNKATIKTLAATKPHLTRTQAARELGASVSHLYRMVGKTTLNKFTRQERPKVEGKMFMRAKTLVESNGYKLVKVK